MQTPFRLKTKEFILFSVYPFTCLTLAALLIVNFINSTLESNSVWTKFVNSDALYLPIIFKDIFENGYSISDWNLPPAPYIFPEFLFFAPAFFVFDDIIHQIHGYAFVSAIVLFLCVFLLVNETELKKASLTIASSFLLIMVCAEALGFQRTSILNSAYHSGTAISAFWILWLILKFIKGRYYFSVPLILISCFFGTMSDALFLTQVSAPAMFTLFFLSFHSSKHFFLKNSLFLGVALLASSLLGHYIRDLFIKAYLKTPVQLNLQFSHKFFNTYEVFLNHLSQQVFIGATVFASLITIGIVFSKILFSQLKNKVGLTTHQSYDIAILIFTISTSLFTVIGFSLINVHIEINRYIIPIQMFPLFCVLYYVNANKITSAITQMLLMTLALFCLIQLNNKNNEPAYYPGWLNCLDKQIIEHNLKYGLVNYGPEKILKGFSKSQASFVQYSGMNNTVRRTNIITNMKEEIPRIDFAISDFGGHSFNETQASTLGSIKTVVNCKTTVMFIFK